MHQTYIIALLMAGIVSWKRGKIAYLPPANAFATEGKGGGKERCKRGAKRKVSARDSKPELASVCFIAQLCASRRAPNTSKLITCSETPLLFVITWV